MFSKYFSKITTLFIAIVFSFGLPLAANATVTTLVDFNSATDLTDKFNSTSSPQFTNQTTGGIQNTGAINVPLGSNEVWTTKQAYTVAGSGDVYTFSAYFKIQANSGYGGLGFTTATTGNTTDSFGSPSTGIGMGFHGGGGFFVNNRSNTNVSWPPDLVIGNWYKMILRVEAKGSNLYDLNFQIWNSDANGVLGTKKTEQTQTNISNTTVGGADIIYGYFSAAGSRMAKIDDFEMTLEGGATFIEAGTPVVVTTDVSNIETTTASSGGEVVNDQGSSVTVRGVCWSTSASPTTADDCTEDGTGTGVFTSSITGVTPNTLYYVRAYATNTSGTSYGAEETFTTDQDVTAPVLTEVTALTGTIDISDAEYQFTTSEACDISSSTPLSDKGTVTTTFDQILAGQTIVTTLQGMEEGGTYSYTFTCVDDAANTSNTLSVGPFTIRQSTRPTTTSVMMQKSVVREETKYTEESNNNSQDSEICPSNLLLNQNLNKGARNGREHTYTRGLVYEAHILQKHLNRLGFDSGPEDGVIGPLTESAIKRMQIFLGTKADGDVGPLTRELINRSCGLKGLYQ